MTTGLFAFFGAFVGVLLSNYMLHKPNSKYEDYDYRNSGFDGYGEK